MLVGRAVSMPLPQRSLWHAKPVHAWLLTKPTPEGRGLHKHAGNPDATVVAEVVCVQQVKQPHQSPVLLAVIWWLCVHNPQPG